MEWLEQGTFISFLSRERKEEVTVVPCVTSPSVCVCVSCVLERERNWVSELGTSCFGNSLDHANLLNTPGIDPGLRGGRGGALFLLNVFVPSQVIAVAWATCWQVNDAWLLRESEIK